MTAMDDHFRDQEVEVPEGVGAPVDEAAAAPVPSKSFDTKRVLSGALMLGLGGLVGYHFYTKYFPGQEAPATSFHVAEVDQAATQHAPVALVTNAPASAASSTEPSPVPVVAAASAPMPAAPVAPEPPSSPKLPSTPAPQATSGVASQVMPRAVAQGAQVASQAGVDQLSQALSAERQARADVSRLSGELKASNDKSSKLEAEVARLNERLRALETSKAAASSVAAHQPQNSTPTRPIQAKPAAASGLPKRAPVVKAQEPQPSPTASAPKAPSTVTAAPARFRIYAMRENMAWVQDIKTRETIPAPVGATLPDGSKVQRVDESEGVITTSSGEIRYAGSGRN